MATVLDTLITRLTLDGSGFQRGLRDAEGKARTFGSNVGSALKSQLSGAFAATAVTAFAKSVFDAADNISDLSDRLNLSTDMVQKLDQAGKKAGVSIGSIEQSVTKLLDNIQTEAKGVPEALSKIGISMEEIKSMSMDQAIIAIVNGLDGLASSGDRAEASLALIGSRGGLKFLQVLQGAREELPKMSAETIVHLGAIADELSAVKSRIVGSAGNFISEVLSDATSVKGALRLAGGGLVSSGIKAFGQAMGITDPEQPTPSGAGDRIGGGAKDDFEQRKQKAVEWMAIQDEILKLEEQTAKNFEDVRVSQLTEEERRNELLTKRANLLRDINALSDVDAARNLNAVSEIDKELAQKTGRGERSGNELFFRRQSDWLTSIGGFTGAGGGQQNQTSQMLSTLQQILNTLESRGIRLRGKF